jgi:hypothetical protein
MPRAFFSRNTWAARGRAHRAGQRRRDLFAGDQPGIQDAFAGNLGIVAGAPLGGLVEKDPGDKYGLARELIASAAAVVSRFRWRIPRDAHPGHRRQARRQWHVIEYNIRIGVTSGPMILRMLRNPADIVRWRRRGTKS